MKRIWRIVPILAALVIASCNGSDTRTTQGLTSGPSAAFTAQVVPTTLTLAREAGTFCDVGTPFVTEFDVLVRPSVPAGLALDRVTLRLFDDQDVIDPAFIPPTTIFGRADLDLRFGTTALDGVRTFRFEPRFGCVDFRPLRMTTELLVIDPAGIADTTSIVVPVVFP